MSRNLINGVFQSKHYLWLLILNLAILGCKQTEEKVKSLSLRQGDFSSTSPWFLLDKGHLCAAAAADEKGQAVFWIYNTEARPTLQKFNLEELETLYPGILKKQVSFAQLNGQVLAYMDFSGPLFAGLQRLLVPRHQWDSSLNYQAWHSQLFLVDTLKFPSPKPDNLAALNALSDRAKGLKPFAQEHYKTYRLSRAEQLAFVHDAQTYTLIDLERALYTQDPVCCTHWANLVNNPRLSWGFVTWRPLQEIEPYWVYALKDWQFSRISRYRDKYVLGLLARDERSQGQLIAKDKRYTEEERPLDWFEQNLLNLGACLALALSDEPGQYYYSAACEAKNTYKACTMVDLNQVTWQSDKSLDFTDLSADSPIYLIFQDQNQPRQHKLYRLERDSLFLEYAFESEAKSWVSSRALVSGRIAFSSPETSECIVWRVKEGPPHYHLRVK